MKILKIQDGRRHVENRFGDNSAAHCSTSVKFCVGKEIARRWSSRDIKLKISQTEDGGLAGANFKIAKAVLDDIFAQKFGTKI